MKERERGDRSLVKQEIDMVQNVKTETENETVWEKREVERQRKRERETDRLIERQNDAIYIYTSTSTVDLNL